MTLVNYSDECGFKYALGCTCCVALDIVFDGLYQDGFL